MNRWLFFTWLYPPAPGGVEEIVRATATGFVGRGRDVLVVTAATPDIGPGDRVEDGVRVVRLEGLHPTDPAPPPEEQLGLLAAAFAPDVIHAHLLSYPWMPDRSDALLRAFRRCDAVLVDQAHGGDFAQDASACVRLMCAVDAVVCDSAYIRDTLHALALGERPGSRPPRFYVVHTPTAPLDVFAPSPEGRARIRATLGFGADDLVVFFPSRFFDVDGRLSKSKRAEVAIDAYNLWARKEGRARLLAVRAPGFWTPESELAARARVDKLLRQGGTSARTVMLDRRVSREQMADLYRAADVCIVPSVEGFGLVYVESMACGTPVVAVDQGAAREVLGNDAAMLVDGGAPLAPRLAAALAELAESPDRRARLGAAGRARAVRLFDPAGWLDGLDAVLLELNPG